jgi:hypothetical protein
VARADRPESCRRTIETGLLLPGDALLGEARLRRIICATPELLACFAEHRAQPAATLICSPQVASPEGPDLDGAGGAGEFPGVRHHLPAARYPVADEFVKRSRERFGMRLLSRKEGAIRN